MLPEGVVKCSGFAAFKAGALDLGDTAFAFLGDFCVVLAFFGFASAATEATDCQVSTSGTGFGATAFGFDGF